MAGEPVLVATVTVVFGATGAAAGPSPARVAEELLAHDHVTTVRIGAHGRPSGFRVDVEGDDHAAAAAWAAGIAPDVATRLGLDAEVLAVGLVRDDVRVEVFRIGEGRGDPVWGER